MKAIIYEKYGSPEVLAFAEITKPIVKSDEVLIKVHAASVTPLDWHMLTGTPCRCQNMNRKTYCLRMPLLLVNFVQPDQEKTSVLE